MPHWKGMDLFPGGGRRLGLALLFSVLCFAQADDYAPEKENVLLKTRLGKQLFKEDVQCGNYFWISRPQVRLLIWCREGETSPSVPKRPTYEL